MYCVLIIILELFWTGVNFFFLENLNSGTNDIFGDGGGNTLAEDGAGDGQQCCFFPSSLNLPFGFLLSSCNEHVHL